MSALRKSNTPAVRRRLCCADSVPLTFQQIRCKGYRSTDLPVWQRRLSAQLSLMVLHADDAFVFGQANCVFRSNRSNNGTTGASDCANPCFAWFATLIVASIFDHLIQISSNEHERQRMRVSVERSETDLTRCCWCTYWCASYINDHQAQSSTKGKFRCANAWAKSIARNYLTKSYTFTCKRTEVSNRTI